VSPTKVAELHAKDQINMPHLPSTLAHQSALLRMHHANAQMKAPAPVCPLDEALRLG
jgi:hypothetical protein